MRHLSLSLFLLIVAHGAFSQTAGAIQGNIKDDSGQPVASAVTTAISTAVGGKTYSTQTSASGAFSFTGIDPGTYSICVQVPGGTHLNPCHWSTPLTVTVAAGKTVSNTTVPVTKGTLLQVRIDDPSKLLAANPKSEILVGIIIQNKMVFQPMRLAATDAGGRTYDVAIPLNTPVKLSITSPTLTLTDDQKATLPLSPISVQAPTATSAPLIHYTVTGHK